MPHPSPRIVYSPHYDIRLVGLERFHPFDSRKYGRAYQVLHKQFGSRLTRLTLRPQGSISRDQLLTFHTAQYLGRLKDPIYVANALEVQALRRFPGRLIDWAVLRHMHWGTIVYIDLDAHQGNGVCHAFFNDNRVFIFDMYNAQNYPVFDVKAKRRIDCPLPLLPGCGDADYLATLRGKLPGFIDSVAKSTNIGLAIYNAGTDIFSGDELGRLNVSSDGVLQRDRFVIDSLVDRGIPTVMLLSGGYSRESYRLVANSVAYVVETFG